MRTATIAVLTLITAVGAWAAEPWFLPYEPDADTLLLLHLDAEGPEQPDAGPLGFSASLRNDATVIDGVFGRAAELDGHTQFVHVGSAEELRLGVDQPFTVECWLRPDSTGGNIFSVSINYYLAASFTKDTGSLGYRASTFPIRWTVLPGIPWRRREWQHVALTHDADRVVRVYLDGRLVSEAQHGDEGTYTEKLGDIIFGAHDGWSQQLAGAFDEIRISQGIREFRPLLAERIYLPDEQVRLNLADVALPERVASIRVTVLDASGEQVAQRELPVAQADEPIVEAAALGAGRAQVEVTFLDAAGETIASVDSPARYAGPEVAELQGRAAAVEQALAACPDDLPERALARGHLDAARAAIGRRDLPGAARGLEAAEARVHMIATGEAAWRAGLREHIRAVPHGDTRVTMSYPAGSADEAEAAIAWAERIGANELVSSHRSATREGLQAWKDAGYHTAVLSSAPIHTADREQPDQSQFGYWYMDTEPAQAGTAEVKLDTVAWGGMSISNHHDPAEHWWVFDLETGDRLPGDRYSFEPGSRLVKISGAEDGRVYRVYYMLATSSIGDPLYEPFAEHGLEALREEIEPLEGVLDTFWYDDLAYVWPGATPQGRSDWESYFASARPENQRAFTQQTGIEFDPRWLVLAPRTLDTPPPAEYVAWMRWVQEQLKPWMRRATDVVHEHGARTWLYWGDAHVGIEPYMGSIDAGNVDEIDKPAADPVTARALVDFPGDAFRRLRVDWLHTHVVGQANASENLRLKWGRTRRGILMQPAQGIYWMPMPNASGLSDAAIRDDLVETLGQIDDEFRLISGELGCERAWEGAANVYVVHSWGKQYSWRPWGDQVLWHLTDLPVRVRFISFSDVIDGGVPEDAHCLLLYGLPDTAWSGGPAWDDERLPHLIKEFVLDGGGLVALQGPSALDDRWALDSVLGMTGTGSADEATGAANYSGDIAIPDEALSAARDAGGASLVRTREVAGLEIAPAIPGMAVNVGAVAVAEDVTVACALVDGETVTPGLAVRDYGEGRVAWITGRSPEYAFSRLVRSAIFWTAHREAEGARLDVTGGDGLFVWAYPDAGTIALLSAADEAAQATVRCDPAILGAAANAPVTDVVTGETLGTAADLAEGLSITAVPNCVRLLRVGEQ